jgi:hypothetical protein
MKALVVMIVKHLHKVGELLAVLEEDNREVRQLLSEGGCFPSKRTFERRLEGSARGATQTDRLSGMLLGGSAETLGE